MNPNIWGPHAWLFLHSITLGYPNNPSETDKINLLNFFNVLSDVLPCKKCRNGFKSHIKEYPLTNEILSSKIKVIKWLIDIHNLVNKENNKKLLSHENAFKELLNVYDTNNKIWIITIIIIIIIIIFIICTIIYNQIVSIRPEN